MTKSTFATGTRPMRRSCELNFLESKMPNSRARSVTGCGLGKSLS